MNKKERDIARVIRALRNGGVAVVPTDTIYGLVARAMDPDAVKRVYKVRGRDAHKPLIILITSIDDMALFGVRLSQEQRAELAHLWRPRQQRKTSVIVSCAQHTHAKWQYLHRGTGTLAFRLVRTNILTHIITKTGPLVAPSANPQGAAPALTIRAARTYFGDCVDGYLGAGRQMDAPPSRLVRLHADGAIDIVRK